MGRGSGRWGGEGGGKGEGREGTPSKNMATGLYNLYPLQQIRIARSRIGLDLIHVQTKLVIKA